MQALAARNGTGPSGSSVSHKASEVAYRVAGIGKQYSGTVVLSGVNIDFVAGEIHGIIGKNGAGKSTLVNIMHGSESPSTGRLEIFGDTVENLTPGRAHDMKVVLVPQKTNYALDLSVAESLFLGSYPKHAMGLIHRSEIMRRSREYLGKVGLDLDPNSLMADVSFENRRLIEVVKALWCFDAKVMILDETTAALSIRPRQKLFELLRKVTRDEGRTVLFISHRLEEMMDICDRISVLRNGELVETANTADLTIERLAELVTGGPVNGAGRGAPVAKTETSTDAKLFRVSSLAQKGKFSGVTFDAGIGEIVGLTGMVGSGYSSLLRYLGGVSPKDGTGMIEIDGHIISPATPQTMKQHAVAYLTNKREEEALFHELPISNNMIGSSFRKFGNRLGVLNHGNISNTVSGLQERLDIKMGPETDLIDSLSGGNKQKVVIARLLNYNLKVYLLDEVAEGIDIGARRVLLDFINTEIRARSAVVMASNVVSDLMEVCDRILVMYHGEVIKTFPRSEFDEHEIYSSLQGIGRSGTNGS